MKVPDNPRIITLFCESVPLNRETPRKIGAFREKFSLIRPVLALIPDFPNRELLELTPLNVRVELGSLCRRLSLRSNAKSETGVSQVKLETL
jgi:hypothetical protein